MFGIGLPEFIIILVIIGLVGGCIFLIRWLEENAPLKIWLAILLGIIFGPLAQFYVPKGGFYFIVLLILPGLIDAGLGNTGVSIYLTSIASPIVLVIRILHFKKTNEI